VSAFRRQACLFQAEDLWAAVQSHSQLQHYVPVQWLHEGRLGINYFLHDKAVPLEWSISASRLMAGGQGLRAGDPRISPLPSVTNCCVMCLEAGVLAAETLQHTLFECPSFEALRSATAIAPLLPGLMQGIAVLSRGLT
jgi:hypothetical protein